MKLIPKLIHTLTLLLAAHLLAAQVTSGGAPLSFSEKFRSEFSELSAAGLPSPDWQRIAEEDKAHPGQRFAAPIPVDFSPGAQGLWTELPNGDRVWRLRLRSAGALALAFFYDEFYLPPGATLFMYGDDGREVLGAYTSRNNRRPGGRFWTGLIRGETATVEYYEPAAVRGQGRLHLYRVDHAYDAETFGAAEDQLKNNFGFGASLDCHVNANCPAGDVLPDQKRSVCRIIVVVEEGMGYCSGALVNNTDNDGTPYLLSAYHCQDGFTPLWDMYRFDFNYRAAGCADPAGEPVFESVLGSQLRAGRPENDFILLELTSPVPPSADAFLSGWNRDAVAPSAGYSFHHPRGDIQKVSLDSAGVIVFPSAINWNNGVTTPANHHFRLHYDVGTFEVGSSGGPLFDQDGRVVGQLHGGVGGTACDPNDIYFGRLSLAWEGGGTPATRLRDWLDPGNTGVLFLDGTDHPGTATGVVQGTILTEENEPVANVVVTLSGPVTVTDTTDASGAFSFGGLLPGGGYSINFEKVDQEQNGVTTLDIIRIQKNILNIEALSSPYKVLAADVNLSGSVTTLDIIKVQKVILGIDPSYGDGLPSWKFFDAAHDFSDPGDPLGDGLTNTIVLPDFSGTLTLDIIGIKSGDVNGSADPGN